MMEPEAKAAAVSSMTDQTNQLHKIAAIMEESLEKLRSDLHLVLRSMPDEDGPSPSYPKPVDMPEPHCPLYDELGVIVNRFNRLLTRVHTITSYIEL